jgi:pentose-5-phosphate-3-epimerase
VSISVSTRILRTACLAAAVLLASLAASAQDAATLRTRHAAMQDKFQKNQFGRPLVLESVQTSGDLKGDVYAIVEHPFAMVQQALQSADHWCDILILHLNVKRCRAGGETPKSIKLNVGRKFDQR